MTSPQTPPGPLLMTQSVGVLSNTTSNSENNTVSTVSTTGTRRSYSSTSSEAGGYTTAPPDSGVAPGAESNTFSSASFGSRLNHGGGSVGSLSSSSATSTAATEQVSEGLRLI